MTKYTEVPTNRNARFGAINTLKSSCLKPSRCLQFVFKLLELESRIKDGAILNLNAFLAEFPDCRMFLKAFYAQNGQSVVSLGEIGELIKSWLDKRLVFDPATVSIPLYGELIDLELAQRLDLTLHNGRKVNLEIMISSLQKVRDFSLLCYYLPLSLLYNHVNRP